MDTRNTTPPPTERQVVLSKSLVVVFGALGIIALAVGVWIMSSGGSDSLEVLYPGAFLCGLALLLYFIGINRRKVFLRSSATADAHVVDRKRRKVRVGLGLDSGSDAGCALVAILMILLLVVEFFLLILEWIGLRERKYHYIDHKLILEFQASKPDIGKTPMTIEMKVSEAIYESNPPGSVVRIRYAMENPNLVELDDEVISRDA